MLIIARPRNGWKRCLVHKRLCFCRFTQPGVLRLLTTVQLMGADEVLTQLQAWSIYDQWLSDERVLYLDEPPRPEKLRFEILPSFAMPLGQDWADSYLIAFAQSRRNPTGYIRQHNRAIGRAIQFCYHIPKSFPAGDSEVARSSPLTAPMRRLDLLSNPDLPVVGVPHVVDEG